MRQAPWEKLSNTDVTPAGTQALALQPQHWYHGETESFIIHYRTFSDALQVAREIEFDLWFVAKTLGATKEQYARKSHVYVFQDEKEWQAFLKGTNSAPWVHSFAMRDDLFLNLHGTGQGFDSRTLAHETTHAVVSRLYGRRRWPLWLSEGFAEAMADACGNVRRGLPPQANPRNLPVANLKVTQLIAVTNYPTDHAAVNELYSSALKFTRYLFTKYPPDLFPKFVDRLLDGALVPAALTETYGAEFLDLPAFERRYLTLIR